MFSSKLLSLKTASSVLRRAKQFSTKHLGPGGYLASIIPKKIPVIEKFDFTNPISPGFNTSVSSIVDTFRMHDPYTTIPSANKKGPEYSSDDFFLVDVVISDDEGVKKDFAVLYDRMGPNLVGVVVGKSLYKMQDFDVANKLLPSRIKDVKPTNSNLGSLSPCDRKDTEFSSVTIRRALLILSEGYNPRKSYAWNESLKILITMTTDSFRFSIARDFIIDCLKLEGDETVKISHNMELILSNWDAISKRVWGSEYPFNMSGTVSDGPISKEMALIMVSLLSSDIEKAKAKKNKGKGGKNKKKSDSSTSEGESHKSESSEDAAIKALLCELLKSESERPENSDVTAAGARQSVANEEFKDKIQEKEFEGIQEVAD